METLKRLLFLVSTSAIVAQKCTNVYPHLSCGLHYDSANSCEQAGCCWDADLSTCYAPVIYGYQYTETEGSPGVMQGSLSLNNPSGISFSEDFKKLDIDIIQETPTRTHIRIVPSGIDRWEVPEELIPRPTGIYEGKQALTKTLVISQHDDDEYDNMEILISRVDKGIPNGELIFVFTKMLVFQDQYIQFVLGVPNNTTATYGFGESSRLTQHLQFNSTYTLWNTDCPASSFENTLYGSHPFFIQVSSTGKAHGVFFLNSNAMDVTLTSSQSQGSTIGLQATGGIVDLYVFAGPTPQDVIKQYLEVIGRPAMVPYWSLGFHNCRWGYPNVQYIADVVRNYSLAEIPLETQWADIDYMDRYLDFTLDPVNFPQAQMDDLVSYLHSQGQRFVPIVDPGIYSQDKAYSTYAKAMEADVFVKDLYGVEPYQGQVWPGPVFFPDWFAANASNWWTASMRDFYSVVQYDGMWIDMNEVSNFCNYFGNGQVCQTIPAAECKTNICCLNCSTPEPDNTFDRPPFVPHTFMKSLGGRTIAMSALHAGGVLEYNAHNLHGLMESIATRDAMISVRKERPFVLSRSTFPSSGRHTAHWTGDNAATWNDLRASIITINNLAMFGISMTGADICGFQEATTEELCTRWIQVGAFSPFSRDHNIREAPPQELFVWDSVAQASRSVLRLRYTLLPFLYTLMYNAHVDGSLVHNAMWTNFPLDQNAFFQDGQYMWGEGVLFTPVLTQGADSVTGYFPSDIWYSLFDHSVIDCSASGRFVELHTPITNTNVHARGGSIIPTQEFAMTTTKARQTPFSLLVHLDSNGSANGNLFLDNGIDVETTLSSVVLYSVRANVLTSSLSRSHFRSESVLGSIQVRAVGSYITSCAGQLKRGLDVVVIPSSTTVEWFEEGNNSKVTFSFDLSGDASVNIDEEYDFSWICS